MPDTTEKSETTEKTDLTKTSAVCAIVTSFDIQSDVDIALFTSKLVELMMTGARSPGFWSGEMNPPQDSTTKKWKLVQRFNTVAETTQWQKSDIRGKLIADFASLSKNAGISIKDEITQAADSNVTTAIVTDVRPGMEEAYFAWESRIQSAQAKYRGYRGAYLQPPAQGREHKWATLLRFDSPATLEEWFASPERQALLIEAEKFVKHTEIRKITSSFPGWAPTDAETGNPPPNWKTGMLVLLGLFPVVSLEIIFVSPLMSQLQPVIRTFINLIGSVAATTYLTMPLFIKTFKWWLFPKGKDHIKIDALGIAILVLLFAVEIAIFWNM